MSQATRKKLFALSRTQRQQVEKIVLRHAQQLNVAGILPSEFDTIYCDVIEAVQLQTLYPAHQLPKVHTWEQAQQYANYIAPKFSY